MGKGRTDAEVPIDRTGGIGWQDGSLPLAGKIRRRLNEEGWEGDVPSAFRFIHIDCPEHPDVVEGDVPAQMQGVDHTYLGLGTVPRPYRAYDESLNRKPETLKALTEAGGPTPTTTSRLPTWGRDSAARSGG